MQQGFSIFNKLERLTWLIPTVMFQKGTIISFGKLEVFFPPKGIESASLSLRGDRNLNLKPRNPNASQSKYGPHRVLTDQTRG